MADNLLMPDASNLGTTIQGLLAQVAPSQQMVDAANKRAQLDFFLGLLGAPKGGEFQRIGDSGRNALSERDNYIKTQQGLAAQNMQLAMPLLQLAQRQQLLGNINDTMNGAMNPTPVNTSVPPGAVGGTGMGGGTQAMFGQGAQPGPVTGPTVNMPAYQTDPGMRQKLARMSVAAKAGLNVDLSPELKFLFPDPIRVNAGGGVYNPATGSMQMTPKSVEGMLPVQGPDGQWRYDNVGNAAQAVAFPTVTKNLANLATKPLSGVLPGGGEGIVGTQLGALGGANGQYGFLNNLLGQGAAPPSTGAPPSSTPVPQGPVQTKLSPEQVKNSQALGDDLAGYREQVSKSSTAVAQLNEISSALNYFKPGPTLPMRAKIAGYAQEIPGVGRTIADQLVPNSAAALPAIAAMEKIGVGLTAEQSKVFGSREGQQVIGMIKSAMPNAEMVPGAPQIIVDAMKGLHQWSIDKGVAAQAWVRNPANHGSLDGFSTAWDTTHPVSSYVGNLPALAAIAKGMPPTAVDQPQAQPQPQSAAKSIVRTGTLNGKRVVQYSDGTVSYTQ